MLSIAGYDPSSGAGVTADIKTIAAHGCFGMTCITALTVQTTQGVSRVQAVSGKLVADTLEELAFDVAWRRSGSGCWAQARWPRRWRQFLERSAPLRNVVLDPVLKSSSGADLLDKRGIEMVQARLLKLADVVTPNTDEAAALTGIKVESLYGMKKAAAKLHEMGATGGGHYRRPPEGASGFAERRAQADWRLRARRSSRTRRTARAVPLPPSLACNLARGFDLKDSVQSAGQYVRRAIARAYPVGKGTGPINHLYGMREA